MNTLQKRPQRLGILLVVVFVCLWLSLVFDSGTTHAYSGNRDHELGVYSLWEYGEYNGELWKETIAVDDPENPAGAFWDIMTGGTSDEYAYTTSRRRENDEVTYQTVFPIPGDGWKSWDQFDMVFFFGHNNMITPPHPTPSDPGGGGFFFWSNESGSWQKISEAWVFWGTRDMPYEYYYRDVTSGREQPGSVTYLWEPFTSALLGYQFQPEELSYYQKSAQDTPSRNSSGTYGAFTSGLGTDDLEWLILYGCQAVIVANQDGSSYNSMGVDAFSRTWDGFHIIMGHYRTYETRQLRDLTPFADHLLSGMPVQAAYFLTDPAQNSSALSAECKPWYRSMSSYLNNYSYMNTDTWTDPKPDINSRCRPRSFLRRFFWYVKWISMDSTLGEHRSMRQWVARGGSAERYDAGFIAIEDAECQEFIKSDGIPVRAREYTVPSGEYALIQLEEVDEEYAWNILEENVSQFSGSGASEGQIKEFNYIVSARIGTEVYWVNKASGAYSFSETDNAMSVPCEIESTEDAVEIALNYVAEMKLVDLQEDETLDVVFVSQVMNAAVDDGEKEPFLSYPSDYFVSFGRRYRGIPVVNSYVTLRIGEEGRLLGVQKNWRRISGELEAVEVDESLLEQMIIEQLLEKEIITEEEDMETIEIVNVCCGYVEGYISNAQDSMGLGCLVNYRHGGSEMISQLVFPVADFDFPLCGVETIEPIEPIEPAKDDEDEPEGEQKSETSYLWAVVLVFIGVAVLNEGVKH